MLPTTRIKKQQIKQRQCVPPTKQRHCPRCRRGEAVSTGATDFETAAQTPNLNQMQLDTLESL